VLGVIPYLPELGIEDEDSASLDSKRRSPGSGRPQTGGKLDIAVIRLPRISNFTDLDPLLEEPDVHLRYVTHPAEWGEPDAVILPGSKNTMEDLLFLRETGLDTHILAHVQERNGWLAGICAGYQMMGRVLLDPDRVESDYARLEGLGLLPTETRFAGEKRTVRVKGSTSLYVQRESEAPHPVEGYEIHMGRTAFLEPAEPPFRIADTRQNESPHGDGAAILGGRVWGTYIHGILHNDEFRRAWLNEIRAAKGWAPKPLELRFRQRREQAFDRLAGHVRKHLDLQRIYEMMGLQKPERQ
jgi:adenosylcobyric acid synthase